ncbi:hypothetical protein [Maribacter sp. 2210JD10-5]|uniref:hypothetical protein n=1 Tax=Maribacter sp. 2210JD10-5 TaxID=3386272 RepID=UPI0039BCCF78
MKLLNCFAILLLFAVSSLTAQEINNHAIGLRLGDSDGFGAEVSYQKSIGRYNRAEFALGWRDSRNFDAFKLAALYQWVRPIDGGFNWYYGFGGGVGSVDFGFDPDRDGGLFVFAAGDVGIEYNFDIPLMLSLDFRPEVGLLGYSDFSDNFDFDVGLGIRYTF